MGRWVRGIGYLFVALVVAALARREPPKPKKPAVAADDVTQITENLNEHLHRYWASSEITVADPAEPKAVLRRMSLALVGSVPSLEEIRAFENDLDEHTDHAGIYDRWARYYLNDQRHHQYLAERLARGVVGDMPAKPFFVYRRRRLVVWFAEQLSQRRPYDRIVQDLIAAEGLWTDTPATNYITGNEMDPDVLAGRTARAFLGLRLDCAQCHDHPFSHWKQSQYHQLAAFFGQTKLGFFGVRDRGGDYEIEDPTTKEKTVIKPGVPYAPELLPDDGRRRRQLAQWITHQDNPYFAKAFVNRIWRLMLGQGLVEPVDDLEQPEAVPGTLDLLADEFKAHHFQIEFLIRTIVTSDAFIRQSAFDGPVESIQENTFAAFPINRLRPEQLARSVMQSASPQTLNTDDDWTVQTIRFFVERDFTNKFGDAGEHELAERSGKLSHRLLLMNGKAVAEQIKPGLFGTANRLNFLAADDEQRVQLAYAMVLCRAPSDEEREYFISTLTNRSVKAKARAINDMIWALVNSTEFSWNH